MIGGKKLKKFLVILLTSSLLFSNAHSIQVQACINNKGAVKSYKDYGKQASIKYMSKDDGKLSESLNVIVKSGSKSKKTKTTKLKSVTCYSTYNTSDIQIEGTQITKVKLTNNALSVWGSFTGRDSKGKEKIYKSKKRTFKLASNVKYCASGEDGEMHTRQNVLNMLNVPEMCCGFSFKLNKSGKVTRIETYL